MTSTDLAELRLSAATILRPGDTVRVGGGAARFTVSRLVETASGAQEVHVYGGRPGFLQARVFRADQVTRCRSKGDPNEPARVALHEVSEASKKRKAGARR